MQTHVQPFPENMKKYGITMQQLPHVIGFIPAHFSNIVDSLAAADESEAASVMDAYISREYFHPAMSGTLVR